MRMGLKAVMGIAAAAALACGGSGGGGGGGTVKVNAATPSGDVTMSGNVALVGGKLEITLSAIRDPDDPTRPADPTKATFTVASGGPALSCTLTKVSTATDAKIDLVFINDTTGSMSGTVNGIANSVQTFAESLAASGVDARFSMYTYGDAFATKAATSTFVTGKGDFAPPSMDGTERPYVGLSDLTAFKAFLTELKASSALGSGGGDGPENTIGAIDYANNHVAYRDGAGKVIIAIGDNPSHQQGSGATASWPVEFRPATGADLVSRMKGKTAIHVVGNDTGAAPYFNLKGLADGTGGVFIDLPPSGNVDLSALKLTDWFTNAFIGTCSAGPKGSYTITVNVRVVGVSGTAKTGTLVFDVVVS
jgi:hypothetical protein